MKLFFGVFFVFLALVAWFTGCAAAAVWVGANFGEDWKYVPVTASFAPIVAGICWFIWEGT